MNSDELNDLKDALIASGCCKNCCLRFLKVREEKYYNNSNNGVFAEGFNYDGNDFKRVKSNTCTVCLGLLQDFIIDSLIQDLQLSKAEEYDSKTFTCSISMPICILLREQLLKIYLKSKFLKLFEEDYQETQLNKTWKMIIKNKLASKLNKTFENSTTCDFSVNFTMDYEDENEELNKLKNAAPDHFNIRNKQRKKFSREMFTRKDVINLLQEIEDENLEKHCLVPPEVPTKCLKLKSIECKHNPLYFAGRYCKYSRNLPQSPWIIDGVKVIETSVQEIIFNKISENFNIPLENLKFSSSGREDCDVRCLGKGRPFYVEIMDPKVTHFTFEQFRKLEYEINESKLIKVRDLQLTVKDELQQIKTGEESKTKRYVCLCVLDGEVSDEKLEILNKSAPLEISQKTPIRVLHRRPVATRKKIIHEMKASRVPHKNNLFKLDVLSQAGTYIKEFVHGDFQRTIPNVGTLIDMEVDILALDVLAINLDWPKPINYD